MANHRGGFLDLQFEVFSFQLTTKKNARFFEIPVNNKAVAAGAPAVFCGRARHFRGNIAAAKHLARLHRLRH